jgi:hypothetical protein
MLAGRQLPAVKRILDVGQPKILNQNRGGRLSLKSQGADFRVSGSAGVGHYFR